jgi:hypothetical protein
MPMNVDQMAEEITLALGQPLPASAQIKSFAQGMIDGLRGGTAIVSGQIVGLSGTGIAAAIQAGAGYPQITPQLAGFGTSFATYVMSSAIVSPSPPIPPSGPILGLSGAAYATILASASGFPAVTPQLLGFATAVMSHISNNAVVVAGVIF